MPHPGNLRSLIYAPFFAVFRDIERSKINQISFRPEYSPLQLCILHLSCSPSLKDDLFFTPPDYAVDIFHHALRNGKFESNLRHDTRLPMMYLPDVIKGTCDMLEADQEKLTIRTYNIGERKC